MLFRFQTTAESEPKIRFLVYDLQSLLSDAVIKDVAYEPKGQDLTLVRDKHNCHISSPGNSVKALSVISQSAEVRASPYTLASLTEFGLQNLHSITKSLMSAIEGVDQLCNPAVICNYYYIMYYILLYYSNTE